MMFGLWLGYSILGMKIVTVDKCIWEYTHAISPSRITGVLKSYTSLSPSGIASFPGSTAQHFLHFGKTRVFPKCKKRWAVEPGNEATSGIHWN